MKKLLFILLVFTACSKEDSSESSPTKLDCKTCDVNVHKKVTGQPSVDYTESSTEYCDGTWKDYDGDTYHNTWTMGATVTDITKKTTCH